MIKERYCSFEVAKLLKEKGFNAGSSKYPTPQMAMDWLREKHNILIWFYPVIPIPVPKDETVFYWEWKLKKKLHSYPQVSDHIKYKTPDEAIEAALKYCLIELI